MKERNIAIFNLIKQNNIKFKISVSTKFLYAAMASRHTNFAIEKTYCKILRCKHRRCLD